MEGKIILLAEKAYLEDIQKELDDFFKEEPKIFNPEVKDKQLDNDIAILKL
jgi:hypothetical protein